MAAAPGVGRRLVLTLAMLLVAAVAIGLVAPTTAPGRERTDTGSFSVGERARVSIMLADATVRVSAAGCGRSSVGTGFAIEGVVVTNSHVVGGAADFGVQSVTRSGESAGRLVQVPVTGDRPATDLAFGPLPWGRPLMPAERDPAVGEPVLLAGYGGGRRLSMVEARVSNAVDGRAYGSDGPAILIDGPTAHGFSGGPVVNRDGDVVAVLRAYDAATGLTVAVPVSVVTQALSMVDEATRSRDVHGEENPC